MTRVAVAALLLLWVLCWCVGLTAALDNTFFFNRTNYCFMTATLPTKSENGLEFCYTHNPHACCLPATDANIRDAFEKITELGAGCSRTKHSVKATYRELREFACLPCMREEPQYRYRTQIGDAHLPGGQNPPDSTAAATKYTWRVCRSFLYGFDGKSGLWGGDGKKYDACGVKQMSSCTSQHQWGFDPRLNSGAGGFVESDQLVLDLDPMAVCGDNLIIPSVEFAEASDPAEQMLGLLAMEIPDFSFVVTNDSDPDFRFNETPCFHGAASPLVAASTLLLLLALCLLSIFTTL